MSAPHLIDTVDDLVSSVEPNNIKDQQDFALWMDLARNMSWDIPSMLMAICPHEELMAKELPMHRPEPGLYSEMFWTWDQIDEHFRRHHDLDLDAKNLNWSFDT